MSQGVGDRAHGESRTRHYLAMGRNANCLVPLKSVHGSLSTAGFAQPQYDLSKGRGLDSLQLCAACPGFPTRHRVRLRLLTLSERRRGWQDRVYNKGLILNEKDAAGLDVIMLAKQGN